MQRRRLWEFGSAVVLGSHGRSKGWPVVGTVRMIAKKLLVVGGVELVVKTWLVSGRHCRHSRLKGVGRKSSGYE